MSKKVIKIGLISHGVCSANLGVSALSLANIKIITEVAKSLNIDVHFLLMSSDKDDAKRIIKAAVGEVSVEVLPAFQFRKPPKFFKEYYRTLKECDAIFDTSGGDSFADIYGAKRFLHQSIVKMLGIMAKTPYILTPQTIGPFKHAITKKVASFILNRVTGIYTRDTMSYDYAKELMENKNLYLTTDMAVMLPYNRSDFSLEGDQSKIKLGLNISGLVYNGGYTGKNQFGLKLDYKQFIDELVGKLVQDDKYEIHLISHVITYGTESDNEVADLFKEKYPNVIVSPLFESPVEAKSYIANMDVFIGTRMHATIGAFSSGVPVIPVAYSRKFEGLFSSVGYDLCIDAIKVGTSEAIELIEKNINKLDELSKMTIDANNNAKGKIETYEKNLSILFKDIVGETNE